MRAAASDPALLATDLAEHLVGAGVPFREAHEIVGGVVARADEQGVPLSSLSSETLREFHPALDLDPASFFSPERSLEARTLIGGPARKNVERAVADARGELDRTGAEIEEGS